jgi:hypothetical protein
MRGPIRRPAGRVYVPDRQIYAGTATMISLRSGSHDVTLPQRLPHVVGLPSRGQAMSTRVRDTAPNRPTDSPSTD